MVRGVWSLGGVVEGNGWLGGREMYVQVENIVI